MGGEEGGDEGVEISENVGEVCVRSTLLLVPNPQEVKKENKKENRL